MPPLLPVNLDSDDEEDDTMFPLPMEQDDNEEELPQLMELQLDDDNDNIDIDNDNDGDGDGESFQFPAQIASDDLQDDGAQQDTNLNIGWDGYNDTDLDDAASAPESPRQFRRSSRSPGGDRLNDVLGSVGHGQRSGFDRSDGRSSRGSANEIGRAHV